MAVIDQDTTGSPASDLWDDNDSTLFQIFTVGRAGLLDSIELTVRVAPQPGSSFQLARLHPSFDPVQPTALVGAGLATVALAGSSAGSVVVDLSSQAIHVEVGDRFVFFVDHDDVLSVAGATGYTGGAAWFQCNAFRECFDPFGPPDRLDATPDEQLFRVEDAHGPRSVAFRTRVVAEPTSAALALAAVSGLVARRRRR